MTDAPPPVLVLIDRAAAGGPPLGPGETGYRVVDPSEHTIHVTDLGVTRGDGIFEGLGVSHGSIQALEPHLARLARSAACSTCPSSTSTWSGPPASSRPGCTSRRRSSCRSSS
jgi:4-amino-4-deoxychorismate lyase